MEILFIILWSFNKKTNRIWTLAWKINTPLTLFRLHYSLDNPKFNGNKKKKIQPTLNLTWFWTEASTSGHPRQNSTSTKPWINQKQANQIFGQNLFAQALTIHIFNTWQIVITSYWVKETNLCLVPVHDKDQGLPHLPQPKIRYYFTHASTFINVKGMHLTCTGSYNLFLSTYVYLANPMPVKYDKTWPIKEADGKQQSCILQNWYLMAYLLSL